MTKSLTEQWKDRELEQALYYVRSNYNNIFVGFPYGINMMRVIDNGCFDVDSIKEVLAPVPSYNEYQGLLSDQLAKNEAIEINAELEHNVERLQEQLDEANEMLKGAKHLTVKDSNGAIMFELVSPEINEYLNKWGVK